MQTAPPPHGLEYWREGKGESERAPPLISPCFWTADEMWPAASCSDGQRLPHWTFNLWAKTHPSSLSTLCLVTTMRKWLTQNTWRKIYQEKWWGWKRCIEKFCKGWPWRCWEPCPRGEDLSRCSEANNLPASFQKSGMPGNLNFSLIKALVYKLSPVVWDWIVPDITLH